jgi:Tol biopolymer transport system component
MKSSRKRQGVLGLVLVTLLGSISLMSQQTKKSSAERLYQEALLKKEGDGDLQAAIKLFTKVIADFPNDRKTASQAQLQIGLCYEKLGTAEAEKAFRKVIEKYADQAEAVSMAKDRLGLLSKPGGMQQPGNTGLSLREISIPEGAPSPDGKFIAYDPGAQPDQLMLYEIATGNKKILRGVPSDRYLEGEDTISWSPDGNQIAFCESKVDFPANLCVINKDGSNYRVVYSDEGIDITAIAGWSPDGKDVYFVTYKYNQPRNIRKVSVAGGKASVILEKKDIRAWAYLSPDGRQIAYEYNPPGGAPLEIRLINSDGNNDRGFISHPAAMSRGFGWTPDSRYFLFESNRMGEQAVWVQGLKDGMPDGEARFIKGFTGTIFAMGAVRGGGFYIRESTGGTDVFTAQIDIQSGKVLRPPQVADPMYSNRASTPFWSPDGEYLAYFFRETGNTSFPFPNHLRIHSTINGKNKDFALDFTPRSLSQTPNWTSDGKSILMMGSGKGGVGVYRINAATGQSEIIYRGGSSTESKEGYPSAWSRDGSTVFLLRSNSTSKFSDQQYSISRKDLKADEERQLFIGPIGGDIGILHLSLDGKWLGFSMHTGNEQSFKSAYYCMSADGGPIRELVEAKDGIGGALFFWAPSGKGALFERVDRARKISTLAYLPSLDSKEIINIGLEASRINQLSFHPDGKTVAFNDIKPSESKVWLLENFLPVKK